MSIVAAAPATRHPPKHENVRMIRNPFRRPERRKQFEAMVRDYTERNPALFRADGRENQSNNIGNAFWRGFHDQPAHWIDPQVPLHVAYVAGRELGRAQRAERSSMA